MKFSLGKDNEWALAGELIKLARLCLCEKCQSQLTDFVMAWKDELEGRVLLGDLQDADDREVESDVLAAWRLKSLLPGLRMFAGYFV